MNSKTTAENIHLGLEYKDKLESLLYVLLEEHYPNEPHKHEFHLGFDWYDNSVEVYFKDQIEYTWEPNLEIRQAILDEGFSIVYWNFINKLGKYTEEIRGDEPRRFKDGPHIYIPKIGYVDNRFNLEDWQKQYCGLQL